MEKIPDWYGEMKKFVCDMRTTYVAYYRSLEELAYLAQQGNAAKIEEKKKQTMELYRRLTIQIDSLEKEAIVDDGYMKQELEKAERNLQ